LCSAGREEGRRRGGEIEWEAVVAWSEWEEAGAIGWWRGVYVARVRGMVVGRGGVSGPFGPVGALVCCLCREPRQPALGKEPSILKIIMLYIT
jgi:hypothetical protein